VNLPYVEMFDAKTNAPIESGQVLVENGGNRTSVFLFVFNATSIFDSSVFFHLFPSQFAL
jgi:predicted membrane channel-forming protein YqfA (hemolysin III family)